LITISRNQLEQNISVTLENNLNTYIFANHDKLDCFETSDVEAEAGSG